MSILKNKNVVITGGTSGIGLATATLFQSEGANLIVTGKADHHFESASSELGESVLVLESDAGNVDEIKQLKRRVEDHFATVDVLFLNAGFIIPSVIEQITEEDFDALFATHVKGPLFATQAFLPLLRQGSTVLITTSNSARVGVDGLHVYQSSKAASGQLVRSLAGELAERGIRVNGVSPGPVATNISENSELAEEANQALIDYTLAKVPMKRFADPAEVAKVVCFLASEGSTFMTGAEVAVDGGWAPGVCR